MFSYTSAVHGIDGNDVKHKKIWLWDSSIQLFSRQFIPLFVASLIILVGIQIPINFCLLFTKTCYKIKSVTHCEYLKPYLDACQAPFKAKHYYYFGIDLLIWPIVFVIGNGILDTEKTLAIYSLVVMVILIYLYHSRTAQLSFCALNWI